MQNWIASKGKSLNRKDPYPYKYNVITKGNFIAIFKNFTEPKRIINKLDTTHT